MVEISSDWLFPRADGNELAERMRQNNREVQYREQVFAHGHDAFLVDADQLAPLIADVIHEGIGACV